MSEYLFAEICNKKENTRNEKSRTCGMADIAEKVQKARLRHIIKKRWRRAGQKHAQHENGNILGRDRREQRTWREADDKGEEDKRNLLEKVQIPKR